MASPRWVHETLEERGVAYQDLHHAEAYTAQELAHREHCSGHHVAKVVVAIADGQPILIVVPASRHVVLEEARKALDAAEIRLATEAEMAKVFPDCQVGAVPPLRHWSDVPVLMDRTLDSAETILFTAGTHADAIRMRFYDWYRLVNPLAGLFSEPEIPSAAPASSEAIPPQTLRTDGDVRLDVLKELKWDPRLDASQIRVSIHDGVVTLSGRVEVYADKFEAEKACKRVRGVRGIANDIEVFPIGPSRYPDPEIAQAALGVLKWDARVPSESVRVTVRDGWITLDGEVANQAEREAAAEAVRKLLGARGLTNSIQLRPNGTIENMKRAIEDALQRNSALDRAHIEVHAHGHQVTLRGIVRSCAERDEAERTAWNAPGVEEVVNEIGVCPTR